MWWWVGVALADCQTEDTSPPFPDDLGLEPVPTDAVLPIHPTEGLTVTLEGPDGPVPGQQLSDGYVPLEELLPDTPYDLRAEWGGYREPETRPFRTGDGPSDATRPPHLDEVHLGGKASVTFSVCGTTQEEHGTALHIEGTLGDWEPLASLQLLLRDGDLEHTREALAFGDTFEVVEAPHGLFTSDLVAFVDEVCVVPLLVDARRDTHRGDAVCAKRSGCDTGAGAPTALGALLAALALRRYKKPGRVA